MLLPLLVTALQMLSQAEVEQALADGVRDKLAQGWNLVDVRSEDDEVTITVANGSRIEHHVAHVDGENNAYRIDAGGKLRADAAPDAFLAQALASGGGIELVSDCGYYYPRGYILDAHVKGKRAASRLVATTLRDAIDIENAYVADGTAELSVALASGHTATLLVTLDDNAKVVAAELRLYADSADDATYQRMDRLKRRIGEAVTSILDGEDGPILVGAKRFELHTSDIESNEPSDHTCGC